MYLQGGMMYGRRVEGTQANTRSNKRKFSRQRWHGRA